MDDSTILTCSRQIKVVRPPQIHTISHRVAASQPPAGPAGSHSDTGLQTKKKKKSHTYNLNPNHKRTTQTISLDAATTIHPLGILRTIRNKHTPVRNLKPDRTSFPVSEFDGILGNEVHIPRGVDVSIPMRSTMTTVTDVPLWVALVKIICQSTIKLNTW